MQLQWKCERDYFEQADKRDGLPVEHSRVGMGQYERTDTPAQQRAAMPYSYRTRDDDGAICRAGRCSSRDDEWAFAPLDVDGPDLGATTIEYKQDDGTWEVL